MKIIQELPWNGTLWNMKKASKYGTNFGFVQTVIDLVSLVTHC